MKKTRMANRKILKWVASGVMLALLFAIVFAGTLSGAFGIENTLQNSGVIENNVADAGYDSNITISAEGRFFYTSDTINKAWSGLTDGKAVIAATGTSYPTDWNQNWYYYKDNSSNKIDLTKSFSTTGFSISNTGNGTRKTYLCAVDYTFTNNSSTSCYVQIAYTLNVARTDGDGLYYSIYTAAFHGKSGSDISAYTTPYEVNASSELNNLGASNIVSVNSKTSNSSGERYVGVKLAANESYHITYVIAKGVTGNTQKCSFSVAINSVSTVFTTGDGTSDNPLQLKNRNDFDTLSHFVGSGYSFENECLKVQPDTNVDGQSDGKTINMATSSSNFTPIGNGTNAFKGTINGNNCTVSNLKVSETNYAGLFGHTSGATISNLSVSGYAHASGLAAGLLIAQMDGGTISGTTNITLTDVGSGDGVYGTYAGGMVGINSGTISGTITVSGSEVDKEDGGVFMMGGVVGYNTGTISATITCSVRVIVRSEGEFNSVKGAFAGGIVGYNNGGTLSGTFTKTSGDVIAPGGHNYVGGIVGYNTGTMSGTFKQQANSATYDSSNIYGGQYVGGVVGYTTGITLNGATSAGLVRGTGSQAVGGIVGGIASGVSIEIKNCTNTGSVTAGDANGVAGIIGHSASATNTIKVSGCTNTGAIYGKVNTGGIGGRIETTSTSGKLTFSNCYNSGAISTSSGNTVGGIVGYLYANADASNIATITYCFNSGSVVSGDSGKSQGAIVGNPAGGTARVVISFCYTTQDMSVSGTSGGATINANNYVIVSSTSNTSVTNGGSLLVYNGLKVAPAVGDTTYKDASDNADWTKITANNINALVVTAGMSNGKYFLSQEGNGGSYLSPSATSTTYSNSSTFTVTARYNASIAKNVYCAIVNIGLSNTSVTYNGDAQNITVSAPTAGGVYSIDKSYTGTSTNNSGNTTAINAGAYSTVILVKIGGVVVGRYDTTFTINSMSLTINSLSYYYGVKIEPTLSALVSGLVSSQHKLSGSITTSSNVYAGFSGDSKTYTYTISNFDIKDSSNNSVKSNYTNLPSSSVTITVKAGDFGVAGTTDIANNPWGSVNNPYLIENAQDLMNLSYLMNGVSGAYGNSIGNTYTVADSASNGYVNCYFAVTANIDMSGKNFTPIGNDSSHRFRGKFFGASSEDYKTRTARTISNLTISSADTDYVGLFGYAHHNFSVTDFKATIEYITLASSCSITGKNYVGGIIGCGQDILIDNCVNNATINGVNYVGGIVGKNYGASTQNCINAGSVNGTSEVGGIAGRAEYGNILSCTNTGKIGTGTNYVGGIAGVIMSNVAVTNCANSGEIVAQAIVGGIVGYVYNSTTVSGSFNTGSVISKGTYATLNDENGAYVGGIAGYNVGTIKNCYNSVASGKYVGISEMYSYGDYAGGITGWNASGATVQYCYADGLIQANSKVGGIVGNNAGTVSYCYFDGSLEGTWSGAGSFGYIVGSGTTATYSWKLPNAKETADSLTTSHVSSSGYYSIVCDSSTSYKLAVGDASCEWSEITSKDINAFVVTAIVANKNYFLSKKGADSSEYLTPSKTSSTHSSASSFTVTARYNANIGNNIYCKVDSISLSNTNPTYNGVVQDIEVSVPTTTGSVYAIDKSYKGVSTNNSGNTDFKNAGNYTTVIYIKIGTVVVGRYDGTFTINAFDLSTADSEHIIFGGNGTLHAVMGNTSEQNLTVSDGPGSYTTYKAYSLNNALIYTASDLYKKANFVVYVKFNNDMGAVLLLSDTSVLTASTSTSASSYDTTSEVLHKAYGAPIAVTLTATGTGNYTGSVSAIYTAMNSDFGGNYNSTDSGYWGSSSSPFIISHPAHLIRLSEIVNGGKAWNSISTTNTDLCVAKNANVASGITARTYQNAYFKVSSSSSELYMVNTEGKQFNFTPIGKSTSYPFSGSFDGQNIPITNLYINSTSDCTGLFGFVQGGYKANTDSSIVSTGASIKNVTVRGSVKGNNYVGGIVGHASFVPIENCKNYATVEGNNYVGGIAGMGGNTVGPSGKAESGWGFNASTLTNAGAITASGNYVGGIIGFARDITFSGTVSNSGAVIGKQNTGGITGILNGGDLSDATNSGNVTGTTNVGGLTGNINWGKLENGTNSGTIIGNGNYVGGIAGVLAKSNKSDGSYIKGTFNNTGCVSGVQYVGGIIGNISYTGDALTRNDTYNWTATVNISSTTLGDGDGVLGQQYVGGAIGHLSGGITISGTINVSGCDVDSNDFTDVKYLGGIVGYNEGTLTGTGTVSVRVIGRSNGSYLGGIVGNNTGTISGTFTKSSGDVISVGKGGSYVGGIAGSSTGIINGTFTHTPTNISYENGNIVGGTYVGGLFGWLDVSSDTNDVTISINNSDNSSYLNLNVTSGTPIEGKNCVGYLFGALVGNGYHTTSGATIGTELKIANTFKGTVNGVEGGAVLGGLVGFMSKSAMMFSKDWSTSNITFGNLTNVSFVGGLVGMLGENGAIESAVTYDSNGSFVTAGVYTITANATFGSASSRLGSFVGGIVGYVTSSAGSYYGDGAYVLGNSIKFANTGSMYGASYVGGIFGAVGDFEESVAPSVSSGYDIASYLTNLLYSGNFAGERSGNTLTINPFATDNWHSVGGGKMTNSGAYVVGNGDYVGGLIGYVGKNTTITLENDEATFENSTDLTTLAIYSGSGYKRIIGTNFVGGIIGYLSDGSHSFKYIVSRVYMGARITSDGTITTTDVTSTYVGGLIGYMASGTMEGCIAMWPDSEMNSGTYAWKGAEYVGGLVGYTSTGSFKNCYTAGFNLTQTSNTKGGLIGFGVSASIEDCWTFYVAVANSTYSTISKSEYGKYVAVDTAVNLTSKWTYASFVGFVTGDTFSFEVSLPSNKQLAFYDASGNDNVTTNTSAFKTFTQSNNVLSIALDKSSGASMLVYVVDVKFVNVAKDTSGQETSHKTTAQNAYRHPSSSEQYDAEIVTATFNTSGYVTQIGANIYFNPTGEAGKSVFVGATTLGNLGNNSVGTYSQTLTPGSEATPITISDLGEWNAWASNASGSTQFVSLIGNIDATGQSITLATGFQGTFNGNGYTINIGSITASADGTSLFPYANGATFKNLTIKGSITSAYNGTAGFVGIAGGSLTFENCTNQVSITSSGKNVGGILGQTHTASATYNFTDCVNTATLQNSVNSNVTGMGGIIGNAITSKGISPSLDNDGNDTGSYLATINLESCRNAGTLTGSFNVGGIIGRNGGITIIMNCGNTGDITGNGSNFSSPQQVANMNTNVGGIGGLTTYNASINVYASYNSGDVLGWGNKAGGIIATDCEYTDSKNTTNIIYCYNTGDIYVGGNVSGKKYDASIAGTKSYGGIAGGIAGGIVNANVQYCYNTGQINGYGIIAVGSGWRTRIGGIVGYVDGYDYTKTIKYCYNTGLIDIGTWGNWNLGFYKGVPNGAGPIIGAAKDQDAEKKIDASNNYSITNSVHYYFNDDGDSSAGYTSQKASSTASWREGTSLASIDLMTAYMNSSGNLAMPSFGISQNTTALTATNGIKSTSGGYVYVYGCLPQLAVFAVDTQNGLAMTSVAYGVDQYGEYTLQSAGSESNPFIVMDGIDLLGIQSLVTKGYDFSGKYIEFANSTNNLNGVETKQITFPSSSSETTKYSGNGYKSYNGSKYTEGSSYHLFSLGAVCSGGVKTPNDSTPYASWLSINYYYSVADGKYLAGGYFDRQNFIAIGRIINNLFAGNISGEQSGGARTKLVGAVIPGSFAGVFSTVLNANISYIELNNSTVSANSTAGGIVGRAYGTTVVDNCAVSGTTAVSTNGSNYYAGGIVGVAKTATSKTDSEHVNEFEQGIVLTISNCVVEGSAKITGTSARVGGILGSMDSAVASKGMNNIVRIKGCAVNGATISTTSSGSYIGGVLGYASTYVISAIEDCSVGNSSSTVTIKGVKDIGGIAGAMTNMQGSYIKDCTIGANAKITATADCSYIGGIVGSTADSASEDGTTMSFQGTNTFNGTIDLASKKAEQIGGVVGYIGKGASFLTGSVVNVGGTINNPASGSADIGGVAGRTTNAAFNGTFAVSPKMNTGIVDNVGGFIGKNTGETHILAEGTTITINGTISGATEVGGFIGVNDGNAKLVIGADMYKAKPYTGSLTITIGATITVGSYNAGGLVGKNEGSISIVKGEISTSGAVSGTDNIGGIVGLNDGDLSTGGSKVEGAGLSITNGGSVSGADYVGGVFGKLNKGTIAGTFTNRGEVTASGYFAGGVIGYLANGASVGSTTNETDILLTNSGSVSAGSYAGGSIGYVAKGASIIANSASVTLENSGSVSATYFAGGSIGILYGLIEGTQTNTVKFTISGSNAGISGTSYLGGSIGVIAGKIDWATFTNEASLTISGGQTAIGGSVGFVGKPSEGYVKINATYDTDYANVKADDIVISNSHFEALGDLTVTGGESEKATSAETTSGGVGGSIGVISNNCFTKDNWTNNTYYAMANVIAPSVNNVGGVFGLIMVDGFTISNMLAYNTKVQGNHNVGGIVGAITGSRVTISSAFALEGSFSGTSNVGGIVGLAQSDTDANTAYWMLGLDNDKLAGSNLEDAIKALGNTTGDAQHGWYFLYAKDANGEGGIGTINVTHDSTSNDENLKYWKRIADAYSSSERANHADTVTLNNSALTASKSVAIGTVYATATAAPVAESGDGYYLYSVTDGEVNPSFEHYETEGKDAFHISISTTQKVGNFAVYYRKIKSGNALIYNGYQRIGVVGMDGVTIFTGDITNYTFAENEREKYYFTTATTETTEGGQSTSTMPMTNAGSYSSEINIYYVDNGGNVYNVGGNKKMTWTIKARDLGVEFDNGDGNRYYGSNAKTDGYDMKFVISNVAPGQYAKEEITITVAYNGKNVEFKLRDGKINNNNLVEITNDGVTLSVLFEDGDVLPDKEKEYTNVDVTDWNSKKMTCYLKFDYAYNYEVSVDIKTTDTSAANYSVPSFDKNKFTVTVRTLTIDVEEWTSSTSSTKPSFEYNTYYQGLSTISIPRGTSDNTDGKGLLDDDTIDLKLKITQKIGNNTKSYNETIKAVSNKTKGTIDVKSVLEKLENFDFAGTYTVEFAVDGAGKYSMDQTKEWTITQYKVKFSGFSETGQSKVYDGTAVVPILTITDIEGENGTYTYKQDKFTLTYTITSSSGTVKGDKLVNVGKYTISLTSTDGEIHATRDGKLDTSDNYAFDSSNSKKDMTYEITAREINITWDKAVYYTTGNGEDNADTKATSAVYYASNRYYGLHIGNVNVDGASSSITTNTINKLVFATGYGTDKITLKWTGKNVNAGTYSMSLSDKDISGKNDGIDTIIDNYKITIDNSNSSYTVNKSKLYVNLVNGSVTKVYDATKDCDGYSLSWTVKSSNSGNDGASGYFAVDKIEYSDSNVGSWNVNVTFKYIGSNSNFERDTSKSLVTTFTGTITPKSVMIILNGLRNGKATKVYDGDKSYAGSISGNGTVGTRLGEKFAVSGLLDSNVTISANYAEAGNDRSMFDSYVNGVFKNADNTYSQVASTYYKKLVFTIQGSGAGNYTFNVYDGTESSANAYCKSSVQGVSDDSKSVQLEVYDTRDKDTHQNADGASDINIEITINSVRVNYTNTYQSYVDESGKYAESWDRVEGSISGASNVVKVHNYWMYEDGIDDGKEEGYKQYTGYTVIKGSKNSKLLYAEVDPSNGMQYNYRLSNQPTLTIAYIVSDSGAFEIDSMSDLLIASFYYSASQNATAPEFVQIVKSGYEWVPLVSNEDYEADIEKWEEEFKKYEGVFLNETSTEDNMEIGWWGYYKATEDSSGKTIPSSFKLTKDIYGMLTSDDIVKLNAFFTVAKSDDNGNITTTSYKWGYDETYLTNMLTTNEGSVVTVLGSLFVTDSGKDGFSGTFDGNGYVIEYLNIMGYGYDNVGLFDVIGSGTVKNLHLRNVNIYANGGNVGGIAGEIKTGDNAVTNVSFHGAINVSGSANVGGLFGKSARSIDKAIVLGTINSSNSSAVVGGVVGTSSASISNVVSMMQVTANSTNTGAFVGSGTSATDSYHMKNAIYNGKDFVNDSNARTYSDLMAGSMSGYGDSNKYYYEYGTTESVKGIYDVLDDYAYVNKDDLDNAKQSMRLKDIVSVYLLMYSLTETKDSINVYAISNSSWLVGSTLGTTDSPIVIANKQNVSLLRELRFATFTLASNIDVTISSTFSGTFYGTVNAGNYKITCNKDMFDVYCNDKSGWLMVEQN